MRGFPRDIQQRRAWHGGLAPGHHQRPVPAVEQLWSDGWHSAGPGTGLLLLSSLPQPYDSLPCSRGTAGSHGAAPGKRFGNKEGAAAPSGQQRSLSVGAGRALPAAAGAHHSQNHWML